MLQQRAGQPVEPTVWPSSGGDLSAAIYGCGHAINAKDRDRPKRWCEDRSQGGVRSTLRCRGQAFKYANTANTRRLSSSDGGRSSFMKILAMCLLIAFSDTIKPLATAAFDRP
jgi:hypothetical protein